MKPKKRTMAEKIIVFILLLVVLFFALNTGMAINQKAELETASGTADKNIISSCSLFMECLEKQLAVIELPDKWNQTIVKSLLIGAFVWLLGTAYYFTSKKNYISGKEFGTSKWARPEEINDLHAKNIMNREISRAKKVKNSIGRYFVKKAIYKECVTEARRIEAFKLSEITGWEKNSLKNAPKSERKRILETAAMKKSAVKSQALAQIKESFTEAWKPEKIKKQQTEQIKSIANDTITNEQQKNEAIKNVNKECAKELKDFYSSKSKIKQIKEKYENADALFTETEHISIYNYVLNNNTLIMGGSGAGKTRGFVIPNILQAHSSFVITDPKGEILEKTGYFLKEIKGYKIHVLNLDDKTKSDGYNPFNYIYPERDGYEERVLSLIEAIILNTDGGEKKSGSDPFWDKAERLFLQAIFFFTCDGFPPEERNINTVQSLIKMLDIKEESDDCNSELDKFKDIFKQKHGANHIGVQQYEEFRSKAAGKTAKSIVVSVVSRLAPFKTKEVRRIFSYDTMGLDRLGEEKSAVFVVVPPTDPTFNFIAGMVFTQMFQELQYCATQVHKHEGQRLPVPVRFILDEFATTCVIPQFVRILAYARSLGVGITPIIQSLEQLKNMYKDEWGVIVDNCNTLLFLGSISHIDTLEYMSKLLGKGTFDKKTTGRTNGKNGSSSKNYDVIGRELMDPSEIRKIPKTDCLFVVSGRNPFYSKKYIYENHPNYYYTSDGSKSNTFEYIAPLPPKTEKASEDSESDNKPDIAEQIKAEEEKLYSEIQKSMNEEKITMTSDIKEIFGEVGNAMDFLTPVPDELYDESVYDISDNSFMELINSSKD